MAFKRSVSFGYGDPDQGALVLGGENSHDFSIVGSDYTESYSSFSATVVLRVFGNGSTDDIRAASLKSNIAALKNLMHYSGNFSLQSDAAVTVTDAALSVSGTVLTVSSATAPFTSDHVGQIVDIEGVGSYQISSFASSSSVGCKLAPELTVPSNATGKTLRIGVVQKRTRDSDRLNGFFCRPELQRVDDGDKKFRKTFVWIGRFEKPADSTKDVVGRRVASIAIRANPGTGLRVVSFRGQFTGTHTSVGATQTAIQNYNNAATDSWITGVLSGFGGITFYEKIVDDVSFDDEDDVLTFSRSYQEKNYKDTTSTFNAAGITNQSISLTRRARWAMGLQDKQAPIMLQVSYTAQIDKNVTSADNLVALYQNTIKPHLIQAVKDQFGGAVIIKDEMPTISLDKSTISVFLDVHVRKSPNQNLYAFNKTVAYSLEMRNDIRDRWSQEANDYTTFSPGARITATVRVSTVVLGLPSQSNIDILNFSNKNPAAGVMNESDASEVQAPGSPPFSQTMTGSSGASWILLAAEIEHTPTFMGKNPESEGTNQLYTESEYTSAWLWGKRKVDATISSANPASNKSGFEPSKTMGSPNDPFKHGPIGIFPAGTSWKEI